MHDLIYKSATELARAIRNREFSSEEVVTACINRIKQVNPKLVAVVNLVEEQALETAQRADALLRQGKILGPLHGVPMTIKDSFDTVGVISAGGTIGRANYYPERHRAYAGARG
jgi:amidase